MPIPLLAGAAIAAVPAIFQGLKGIKQARQASRLKPVRPNYTIPGAVHESVDMARIGANAAMPGYGTARNNVQGATANAVRSAQMAGSGNNVLATIAAAQGNEANAMNSLATQNAQFQFGQRNNLQNSLLNLGQYQEKQWDYNQKQRYDEQAAAKAALREGSSHNINNALGGLSSAALVGFGTKAPGTAAATTQAAGIPGINLQNGLIPNQQMYAGNPYPSNLG